MSDETINMDGEIRRFQAALLARWFKSRKDLRLIAGQNFGGVINNLFGLTPPMWSSFIRPGPGLKEKKGGGIKVDFDQGKVRSNNTISNDVSQATWTLSDAGKKVNKDVPSRGMDVISTYLKCRNDRKRYRGGFPRNPVSEHDQKKLHDFLLNRQGYTAGGWMEAAKFFIVPVAAAWVRRWSGRGGHKGKGYQINGEKEIELYAENPTKHHSAGQIQQRVAIAVRMQIDVIYRDFAWWFNDNFTNL